jgi:hypothetical protein
MWVVVCCWLLLVGVGVCLLFVVVDELINQSINHQQ